MRALLKGVLRVVVPIVSLIVAYGMNNYIALHYGPMLTAQFGEVSRQVIPIVVFTVVGGVAYRLVAR